MSATQREADVRGQLLPLSGLLAHKATGKPGPLGFVGRSVRKLVKVLIRPWLDFQTRCNHAVIEQLARQDGQQGVQQGVQQELGDRQARTEATVEGLRRRLMVLADRVAVADHVAADELTGAGGGALELLPLVEQLSVRLAWVTRRLEVLEGENRHLRERADRLTSAVVAGAGQHALLRDEFVKSVGGSGEAAERLEAGRVEWAGLGVPGRFQLTSQPCTAEQMHRPRFRRWAEELRFGFFAHRKVWEWCYIVDAIYERGLLRPGARGLGFAVGREPLTSLFAAHGCEVVATDLGADAERSGEWDTTDQHASDVAHLNTRGICPPAEFADRVTFRPVDMNAIPPDLTGFDFVWSSCSIEHLGSLEHGKKFLENMAACLKPGGVAVHTTEYNVASDDATVETGDSVIFRRRDIEEMAARLRAVGCTLVERNYFTGDTPDDRHVDQEPYSRSPHLKLNLSGFVSTSFGLIVVKDG